MLNLRDELNILTYNPLIKDVHYKVIFDNNILDNLETKLNEMNNNILDFINNEKLCSEMIKSSQDWFEKNCSINGQTKIFEEIFESFLNII